MKDFDEILECVDWTKMAAPQADGYDTDVTLQLARHGSSPLRNSPHCRKAPGEAATICDGKVAVRNLPQRSIASDKLLGASLDHPNLNAAATFLARWPAAYDQFKALIDTVYPYTSPEQSRLGTLALGSSSHSYEDDFGSVHATVDCPLGLAQALVHEMAHQKLRALGVSLESAARLIINPAAQMFESPIRKDRRRPMTAVFHAQYSFIYVTALDLNMLATAENKREQQLILMLLARNVPRMQAGHTEIEKHIEVDSAGAQFLDAFMCWSRDVLSEGEATLQACGYG